MEKRKKKAKQISAVLFLVPQYNWPLPWSTQKIKDCVSHRKSAICYRRIDWRQRKIGNDKQEEADSLLHDTTSHTQHLYRLSTS